MRSCSVGPSGSGAAPTRAVASCSATTACLGPTGPPSRQSPGCCSPILGLWLLPQAWLWLPFGAIILFNIAMSGYTRSAHAAPAGQPRPAGPRGGLAQAKDVGLGRIGRLPPSGYGRWAASHARAMSVWAPPSARTTRPRRRRGVEPGRGPWGQRGSSATAISVCSSTEKVTLGSSRSYRSAPVFSRDNTMPLTQSPSFLSSQSSLS